MLTKEKNGLTWLEFHLLQNYPLKHGVFLKQGGVSLAPYASLNLGDNVGDKENDVHLNRQRVLDALSLPSLAFTRQCHGIDIACINEPTITPIEADAMVTDHKNIGLMITHADCQAAIFYDPVHHIIANVHSGWRGSVQNIYQITVHYMTKHFHSNPKEILVCISPSLGPKSAEFKNYQKELPASFFPYKAENYLFDFWKISTMQLLSLGILEKHIEVAEIDTFTHPDLFSYRREKITGRNGTLVALS